MPFEKLPLAISPYFIEFFNLGKRNFFFRCAWYKSIIATNLWLIMIHFNVLDFNVCHSETVISFF